MKDLYFPLCWKEVSEDNIVILISHPNGTRTFTKVDKENRAQTRTFVAWFRKMFPDVLTEFRPTIDGYYARYDGKRHFAAYGVTRKQMMLIKLAWTYKAVDIIHTRNDYWRPEYNPEQVTINEWALKPSRDLLNRLEAKKLKEEALAAEKLSTAQSTDC